MRVWSRALVAVLLLCAAVAARAADEIDQAPGFQLEPNEEDLAVVIGIAQYRDVKSASQFSDDDARLMKKYLLSLGFREIAFCGVQFAFGVIDGSLPAPVGVVGTR